MELRTRGAVLLATGAVAGALHVGTASASAMTFTGVTGQGYEVVVTTEGGFVERVDIAARMECRRDGSLVERSSWTEPFDLSLPLRFSDADGYRYRLGRKTRVRTFGTISGEAVSPEQWAGEFRVKAVLRRRDSVIDRCRMQPTDWTAYSG
jgi:hypothetical protein